MKINFLPAAIISATIMSCSTSYKTGQTPDDVYYSPARPQNDYVRKNTDEDKSVYINSGENEVRRRVNNRRYRRYDDRYDNRYDYPYGYSNGYNNGYYTYPPVYVNPKMGALQNNSQPRKTNLGAYNPNTTNTTPDSSSSYNPKFGRVNSGSSSPVRTFENPPANNGTSVGNFIRKLFSNDNYNNSYNNNNYNNSDNRYQNNSNTYTPSRTFESGNNDRNSFKSSSSSDNKNNSTNAPVRTFKKDDN